MVFKYLGVDENGKLIEQEDGFKSPDWAFKTIDNAIHPCICYDAVVLSDQLVSIGGSTYYKNNVVPIKMDTVKSLQDFQEDGDMFIKDANHKLPDPYTTKLPPFTSAVIMACLKKEKQIPLTKEEHQSKLTIIRSIKSLIGTDNELSIKKASELLGYYGLTINVLLKDEYITNKG